MNDSGTENKGKKDEIKEREEPTPSSVTSAPVENKETVADTLREIKSEREARR